MQILILEKLNALIFHMSHQILFLKSTNTIP